MFQSHELYKTYCQARIADLEQRAGRAMERTGATPMRSNSYKKSRVADFGHKDAQIYSCSSVY